VRELIAHYESQTEEEAVAEDEAAFEHESTSMVEVPNDLLPAVRDLLGKRLSIRQAPGPSGVRGCAHAPAHGLRTLPVG
jgi:hypothetical protein